MAAAAEEAVLAGSLCCDHAFEQALQLSPPTWLGLQFDDHFDLPSDRSHSHAGCRAGMPLRQALLPLPRSPRTCLRFDVDGRRLDNPVCLCLGGYLRRRRDVDDAPWASPHADHWFTGATPVHGAGRRT